MNGILFVDDERDNVSLVAEILAEALDVECLVVESVEDAVLALLHRPFKLVVMDLFIPLGDSPERVLGPRAMRYQAQVQHLGGLVLLDEIERMQVKPEVLSHTACTDHVLLELFGDRVSRRIPKPAPMDMLLRNIMEVYRGEDG